MTPLSIFATLLGVLISIGTLLTVTVPALRNKLKKRLFFREELEREMHEIHRLLREHVAQDAQKQKEIDLQKEVDLCVLRDLITAIYYRRAKEKKIHVYELEDASALHDLYQKRGGNSYVHALFRQMSKEWDVIR